MAARLNPRNQESVREKIRATQLVNRLQNYALTKLNSIKIKDHLMSDGQVRAAISLLNKCVPDLQRSELTGPGGGPLALGILRFDPAQQLEAPRVPDAFMDSSGARLQASGGVLAQESGQGRPVPALDVHTSRDGAGNLLVHVAPGEPGAESSVGHDRQTNRTPED